MGRDSHNVRGYSKYVATSPVITELCDKHPQHHDHCFENQILRNRDELLYANMCYTMNAGDIGCVEGSVAPWVLMLRATGKHKYALICSILSGT